MHQTIKPAPVRKTVRVNAAPTLAFEVFTADIGRWWPKTHHLGKAAPETFVIEPRVGGRWFERGVDGVECDIGTVLVWDPPARLVLGWDLGADWKLEPDLATEVEVRFIPEGANATRVELEHRNLERLGDRAQDFRQKIDSPNGWTAVLECFSQSANRTERSAS